MLVPQPLLAESRARKPEGPPSYKSAHSTDLSAHPILTNGSDESFKKNLSVPLAIRLGRHRDARMISPIRVDSCPFVVFCSAPFAYGSSVPDSITLPDHETVPRPLPVLDEYFFPRPGCACRSSGRLYQNGNGGT